MYYARRGQVASRPHLNLPEDTFEEELGLDGFFGPVSHIYHRSAPTDWSDLRASSFQWPERENIESLSLRPQSFGAISDSAAEANFFSSYRALFWNEDIEIGVQRFNEYSEVYFRNSDASELFFCHSGKGLLDSVFGELKFHAGDYICIPKGVSYRWKLEEEVYFLRIQNFGEAFKKPDTGLMGQQALYHEENLRLPDLNTDTNESSSTIRVQVRQKLHEIVYPYDIRNVAGWCGTLYPFTLSVHQIAPAMSSMAHLPPSINSTFLNKDFVVCTFLPRPLEEPAGALKVPFFHSNIDYDEVIFYHAGDFFSRDNMGAGFISLHPRGINHGPHPKALKNQSKLTRTNEIAVMVDTRRSLAVTSYARSLENKDYWKSWQRK